MFAKSPDSHIRGPAFIQVTVVYVSSPILELIEVGHAGLKRTAIFDGLSQGVQSLGYSLGQTPACLAALVVNSTIHCIQNL